MNPTVAPDPSDPTWRQLSPRLWAGRRDDSPLGEIEQGYRFTYTEPSGRSHVGYPSLAAAQAAATGPISTVTAYERAGTGAARGFRAAIVLLTAVAAVALAVVGVLLLT